MNRTIHNEVQD